MLRRFTTTCNSRQQQLYQDYTRPLSKKARKAARKKEAKWRPIITNLKSQVQAAFRRNARSDQDKLLIHEARAHLRQSLLPLYTSVDIENISLFSRGLHFTDMRDCPVDFAIVDRENPRGISRRDTPAIYDFKKVVDALTAAGYSGYVYTSPDRQPPVGRGYHPFKIPWADYQDLPREGYAYPLKLQLCPPDSYALLPYTLTLPGPTVVPLHSWLGKTFRPLTATTLQALWLFMQYNGLRAFSLTTLALMLLKQLQAEYNTPPLFAPPYHKLLRVWVPHSVPVDASTRLYEKTEWFTYPKLLESGYSDYVFGKQLSISSRLHRFFEYWGESDILADNSIVSLREQPDPHHPILSMPRRVKYLPKKTAVFPEYGLPQSDNAQPLHWCTHPLVVQDPLLPSHNHAEGISEGTFALFKQKCKHAANLVAKGVEFNAILYHDQRQEPDTVFTDIPPPKTLDESDKVDKPFGMRVSPAVERPAYGTKRMHVVADPSPLHVDIGKRPSLRAGRDTPPYGLRHFHSSVGRSDTAISYSNPPENAQEILARFEETRKRLEIAIQSRWGNDYTVAIFGSVSYGVWTAESDLDLIILDRRRPNFYSRKGDIYSVRGLGKELVSQGYKVIRVVPQAKVPIVKFYDPVTKVYCDVNVNDRLGIYNSRLLAHYCDLLPVLRPMLRVIKKWARIHGLNSPSLVDAKHRSDVTFSSYALTLMTISFLQNRGLLPNLQTGLLAKPPPESYWKIRKLKVDIRFRTTIDWKPRQVSLAEILTEWFKFWGFTFPFRYDQVSVKVGRIIPESQHEIDRRTSQTPGPVKIFVRDPFLPNKNVTKLIMRPALLKFQRCCQEALHAMERGESFLDGDAESKMETATMIDANVERETEPPVA